ncbi:MAG TPA: hypothetical protein VG099_16550 [Gemmataceae bacterium]|nr:hypothetical protein [Gemmataceae bacterium]
MQADTGLSGISAIVTSVQQTMLINDTFTDTNGTNLTAHTPDIKVSTGWVANTGTITIQNNQANSTQNFPYYSIETGQSNVTIQAIVTPAGSAACGLSGRVSNATNSWDIDIQVIGGNVTLTIQEQAAGVFTVRATTTFTDPGAPRTVQGVFSGANVSATVNGGNQIAYGSASSNQTVTKHGINMGTGWNIDNYQVTNP